MTCRTLLEWLSKKTDYELDAFDVSIKIHDEFYSIASVTDSDPDADGILDDDSPVIVVSMPEED